MKLIFLHHSTGANLIREGNVRQLLGQEIPDLEFWDHNYNSLLFNLFNHTGLSDNNGRVLGIDYKIPHNNTNPDGLADIFSQQITNPPTNTLSFLLDYDLIAFKSCFPVTKITTDQQLAEYKNFYQKIRLRIDDEFPKKIFIVFTPPPLRKEKTKLEFAKRAQEFSGWLQSNEFLQEAKNIKVFDFFSLLSDQNGFLKKEYCRLFPWDSHPNKKANQVIGPVLVSFIKSIVL